MSKINRPPVGLQFLLGSQNFGENPSHLAQQVTPTLDLFEFYATELLRHDDTVGGRQTPGMISSLLSNGRRAIKGLSIISTTTITGTVSSLQFGVSISNVPGTATDPEHWLYISPLMNPLGGGVDFGAMAVTFEKPIIIEGSTTLQYHLLSSDLSVSETWRCSVLYYDLDGLSENF